MEGKNTTKVSLELPTEVLDFVKAGAAFSGTTKEQILQAWIAERYQQMNAKAEKPKHKPKVHVRYPGQTETRLVRVGDSNEYERVEVEAPENFEALDKEVAQWLDNAISFWTRQRLRNDDIPLKQFDILNKRLHATLDEYVELLQRVRAYCELENAPEELVRKILIEANVTHGRLVEHLATYSGEDFTHAVADNWIKKIAKMLGHMERNIASVFFEKSQKALWTDGTSQVGEGQLEMHRAYHNMAEVFIGASGKKTFEMARNAKTLQEAIAAVDHVLVLIEKKPTNGLFDVVLEMISTMNRRMQEAGKLKGKESEKYRNLMGMVRESVGGARLAYDNFEETKVEIRDAEKMQGGFKAIRNLPDDHPSRIAMTAQRKSILAARRILDKGVRRMGESISNLQHLVLAMQEGDVHEDTALKDIPNIINENKLSTGKVTKNALSALYAEYGKTPKEIEEFLRWDVDIPVIREPAIKSVAKEVWSHGKPAFLFEYTPGGPAEAGRAQSGSVQLNPVWNKLDPEYLETRHCYHSLKALAQFWYAGNITVKEASYLQIPPTQVDPQDREQKYLLDYVRLDEVRFSGGDEKQKKARAYQLMKLIGNVCKNEGWHTPLFFPALPDPVWEEQADGGLPEHRYLRIIWHPDSDGLSGQQLQKVLGEGDRYVEAPIYQLIGDDCPDRPAGWPNPAAVREIEEGDSILVDIAVERDQMERAAKRGK